MPHIDYCSIVYLDINASLRDKLQKLQNSCVRYICSARKDEHITSYRLRVGWIKVEERRNYFSTLLLYKIIRMGQPPYLTSLFKKNENRTSARAAERGVVWNLVFPKTCTDVGFFSFKVNGARLWNSIPSNIKFLPSLYKFKISIRNHFEESSRSL